MFTNLGTPAMILMETGYHLEPTSDGDARWSIFIRLRETLLIDFGELMDYRKKNVSGSYLRLRHKELRVRQGSDLQQDYQQWKSRVDTNVEESERRELKNIAIQQYKSLARFRSTLTSLPENFSDLSKKEQNSKILPFCLAKIPAGITSLALDRNLPAFHPIVNGLTSGKIEMDLLGEYLAFPEEWVRKLVY